MFKEEKVGEALLILFSLGFLLLLLSFFFTLFAHFSNIILVMENRGAGSALREGFRFLKSHFGSSAGLYILLVLIQLGIGFAFSIFQFPFSFIPILGTLIYLFLLPLQTLLSIYLTLFLTATLMVFYKDRTRGETVEFQL